MIEPTGCKAPVPGTVLEATTAAKAKAKDAAKEVASQKVAVASDADQDDGSTAMKINRHTGAASPAIRRAALQEDRNRARESQDVLCADRNARTVRIAQLIRTSCRQ